MAPLATRLLCEKIVHFVIKVLNLVKRPFLCTYQFQIGRHREREEIGMFSRVFQNGRPAKPEVNIITAENCQIHLLQC